MAKCFQLVRVSAFAGLLCSTAVSTVLLPQAATANVPQGTELRVTSPQRTVTRVERAAVSGERFRVGPNDTFEILFSDGGSVSLAPGSTLFVNQFEFDQASGSGSLRLTLEQGSMRVIGGILNQKAPIQIDAGLAQMSLANGGAFITRSPDSLRAALLVAGTLEVRANGRAETLKRPGFELVVGRGSALTGPTRQRKGQAFADAATINPGLRTGGTATLRTADEAEGIILADDNTIDENARRSQAFLSPANDFAIALPDGSIVTALAPSTGPLASQGFAEGVSDQAPDLVLAQEYARAQVYEEGRTHYGVSELRDPGPTANRLLPAGTYEYEVSGLAPSRIVPLSGSELVYQVSFGYSYAPTLVFALTGLEDTTGDLSSFSLAVPLATVVGLPDRVLSSTYTTNFFYDNFENVLGSADPFLPNPSFDVFKRDENGEIVVGPGGEVIQVDIRGLSAGFADPDTWLSEPIWGAIPDTDPPIEEIIAIPLRFDPRSSDNFVMLEVQDLYGHNFVFAAGDIAAVRSGGESIDSFVLTRGLNPMDFGPGGSLPSLTTASAFRGFVPSSASFLGALDRLEATPLLVFNQSGSGDMTSRLFHADLAVSADGSSSTISSTLGTINYNVGEGGLDDERARVTVSGATIGSTMTPDEGATLFNSPLIASAVGGGGDWAGAGVRPGYASYLVLENVSNDPLSSAAGGDIAPLGQESTRYGLLRLASGVQSQALAGNLAAGRDAASGQYQGFVAGLHQTEGDPPDGLYQGALALGLDAATGGVAALVSYTRPFATPGECNSTCTIALGAAAISGGESAYILPGWYGASVSSLGGANAALIAGAGVQDGLGISDPSREIKEYKHVQWGFFFGDLLPQAGRRTHTALSTWVAGRRFDKGWGGDNNERIQGSARYRGHAIGTVQNQQNTYTAVGTFEQTWNLDARIGSMSMAFDGQNYVGRNSLGHESGRSGISYGGYLTNSSGPVLQARIDGELVDVQNRQPQGTIGTFMIRGFDATYQATGTFAGDIDD